MRSIIGDKILIMVVVGSAVWDKTFINPRRACAARVTVVVLCVCVCVFPRPSYATDATKRQSRHTGGLSIVFASV